MGARADGGQETLPVAAAQSPPLTAESCFNYLVGRRLLDVPALVERGIRVIEVPGRNRNFAVHSGSGRGCFVKQAPRGEIGSRGPLAVEAALYTWIATDPSAAPLRAACPSRLHFDPGRSILVLELLRDARTFQAFGEHAPPAAVAQLHGEVAAALAACHRLPVREDAAIAEWLPLAAPWVFDIGRPSPASLRELAPAQLHLIRALQSARDLMERLDELRAAWRPSHLIHGDFKWSNVLVVHDAAGAPARICLLDWELAQLGDPAWDVGASLHAIIAEAVLGHAFPDGLTPGEASASLGAIIPTLHATHRDVWHHYLAAAQLDGAEATALLDRLPDHVAVRLIKSAYEWSQAEVQIPRRAAAILQLGINMLRQPDQARQLVLGLEGSASAPP